MLYMYMYSLCNEHKLLSCSLIESNYDSLFARTVTHPVQVAYWTIEVMPPCGTSVPCQLRPVVRRHGRGVPWAGGDPCMTGSLEGLLAAQSSRKVKVKPLLMEPGLRQRHP